MDNNSSNNSSALQKGKIQTRWTYVVSSKIIFKTANQYMS